MGKGTLVFDKEAVEIGESRDLRLKVSAAFGFSSH